MGFNQQFLKCIINLAIWVNYKSGRGKGNETDWEMAQLPMLSGYLIAEKICLSHWDKVRTFIYLDAYLIHTCDSRKVK